MNKEFFLKDGTKVNFGDKIKATKEDNGAKVTVIATISEDNVDYLVEMGVLDWVNVEDSKEDQDPSLELFLYMLAERANMKPENLCNLLNKLASFNQGAAFVAVLREVAIWLDKQYEDHIENSPEIWVVSLSNGKIAQLDKSKISNYKNFAAFRTKSDAQRACKICRTLLREMFKGGKQKD